MRLIKVKTNAQKRSYLSFINNLYKNDKNYVCTAKFNAKMLLFQQTDFAKTMYVQPIIICDDEKIQAVCTYFQNYTLPYLQIGLFEALDNAKPAVKLIIEEAKRISKKNNLNKIILGLNGHLSYGVGILERNFKNKISFDSIYNKSYYKELFLPYITSEEYLMTYRTTIVDLRKKLQNKNHISDITIRSANLKQFSKELEIMRNLCDQTLGKTFLYTKTQKGHFSQQMSGLKPLLKNENLLFAMQNQKEIAFLFWHPDYNCMLDGGRDYNLLQIFMKTKFASSKSDTIKLNAIGSINSFATVKLIQKVSEFISENYKFAQTSFVWENNKSSTLLCRQLFEREDRKYGVYFIDMDIKDEVEKIL